MVIALAVAYKHFGEWLLEQRKKARFSQEELAELAKVSKNYISTIERNLPNYKTGALPRPSRKVIEALADALDISRSEALRVFIQLSGDQPADPLDSDFGDDMEGEDIRRLVKLYTGLPKDQKKLTLKQLETMQEYYRQKALEQEDEEEKP